MVAKVQDTIDLEEALDVESDDGAPAASGPAAADPAPQAPVVELTPQVLRSQMLLLVQSLVDALPDETVVFARQLVEEGRCGPAASALLFDALRYRVQLSPVEFAVLQECLAAAGESTEFVQYLTVSNEARPLLFTFAAEPPPTDVTGAPITSSTVRTHDERVLLEVAGRPAVLGVWRAWRSAATDSPWPQPRPVYLVEVAEQAAIDELSDAFYGAGALPVRAGEPVVEIYLTGNDIPGLHRAVQFAGSLLHPVDGDAQFAFADVFEGEPGPDGAPQDLVHVDDETAERMLAYLAAGKPLMMADAQGDDLLAAERTGVVPLHLRTDGVWIWSDASAYYLREHKVAPPREFAAHLAAAEPVPGNVSDALLHQAVSWLQTDE